MKFQRVLTWEKRKIKIIAEIFSFLVKTFLNVSIFPKSLKYQEAGSAGNKK